MMIPYSLLLQLFNFARCQLFVLAGVSVRIFSCASACFGLLLFPFPIFITATIRRGIIISLIAIINLIRLFGLLIIFICSITLTAYTCLQLFKRINGICPCISSSLCRFSHVHPIRIHKPDRVVVCVCIGAPPSILIS